MKARLSTIGIAFALSTVTVVQAQDAWVPYQGQASITAVYTFQTFDEFYGPEGQRKYPFGTSNQSTVFATLEYGITDAIAVDATVAYTHVATSQSPSAPAGAVDSGLADTAIGVRWKIVDEFASKHAPTVTLRVGGTVAGTYDAGFPYSAGDGASGVEAAMLLARDFESLGLYGEAAYRHRADRVPSELVGVGGLYKVFGDWSTSAGFRHVRSLSGSELGDPGFRFQELREIGSFVEASVGHSSTSGRYIGVHFAQTVGGRNTAKKTVFGLSVNFPLR